MMLQTGSLVGEDILLVLIGLSWMRLDLDSSYFPGIIPQDGGFKGPQPTPEMHPHLRLEQTMTSMPKVYPGDAVFWHCDVLHAVEEEHTGNDDSAGASDR